MKQGQRPVHIMRWAPADYVNDPFVKLLLARRDYTTSTFYNLFLNWSHIEGGDLPGAPDQLAAIVSMPIKDVTKALVVCREAGKITVSNGRAYHKRVKRGIEEELRYRAEQAALGREGGVRSGQARRAKSAKGTLTYDRKGTLHDEGKGTLREKRSPPPPPPPPSSPPLPLPDPPPPPSQTGGGVGGLTLDEAACPDCKTTGTLRRQRSGDGWFCGTRLGGCNAHFELAEPAIVKQLSERARGSIRARVEREDGPSVADTSESPEVWLELKGLTIDSLLAECNAWVEEWGVAGEAETITRSRWYEQRGVPESVVPLLAIERRRREGRAPPAAAKSRPETGAHEANAERRQP